MLETLSPIIRYRFSNKYKWMLIVALLVLVVFHITVFVLPFLTTVSKDTIERLDKVSDTIGNITSTIVLILLIVLAQVSLYEYYQKKRNDLYSSVEKQIREWFDKMNTIKQTDYIISNDRLRHFQVKANWQSSHFNKEGIEPCKLYFENVHYELTHYPSKLIYGIHFEFNNIAINSKICEKFVSMINFQNMYSFLMIDREIPKQPGWIFLIKGIELSGDFEKDAPLISTHARHFVELVGHTFSALYSPELLLIYTNFINQKILIHDSP